MVDVVDAATRSRMMSGIRGKNTKPEILLRRVMHARGFRYRLHDRKLPGHPDLVFPRYHAVVFVHGCFWHRHEECRFATIPATRPEFWTEKFQANVARDSKNEVMLNEAGWRIAVVWECSLKRSAGNVGEQLSAWLESATDDRLEL
ncbi:DNA mismatch endonuclease (patch repair protein) [Sphingobium xanthum]|uniref:very short patch repair endonuclease n=1 Tax=Sphingobium xanthum TaxID=1387165 RepID=UPI001C8CA754